MVCLHYESMGKPLATHLPHDWIDAGNIAGRLLNRFLSEFEQDNWPGKEHIGELLENPEEEALIASLLFDNPPFEDPLKVANEGLRLLRSRFYEPRLRQIELDLANYHADSNSDPISLLKDRSVIQRQLRQPLDLSAAV